MKLFISRVTLDSSSNIGYLKSGSILFGDLEKVVWVLLKYNNNMSLRICLEKAFYEINNVSPSTNKN